MVRFRYETQNDHCRVSESVYCRGDVRLCFNEHDEHHFFERESGFSGGHADSRIGCHLGVARPAAVRAHLMKPSRRQVEHLT